MMHVCEHKIQVNINSYDPTRTTGLRNAFAKDMRRRFSELARVVRTTVDTNDCFGLRPETPKNAIIAAYQMNPAPAGAFSFPISSKKIEEFNRWLNAQIDKGILTTTTIPQLGGTALSQQYPWYWTNTYIEDSYKRGLQRARYEMKKTGYDVPTVDATGGIQAAMSGPFHVDRIGLLFARTFSDLKGITAAMDTQISRVLAQGLADGDGPRLLARKLVSVIQGGGADLGIKDTLGRFIPARRRAEILARTETIRAHHQSTIQEYENWGAAGVIVKAEWMTAGDERVCAQCSSLQGEVFTLEAIRPMIPLHPQCRCIALPYKERTKPDPISIQPSKPKPKPRRPKAPKQDWQKDKVAQKFIDPGHGKKYYDYKKVYRQSLIDNFGDDGARSLKPQAEYWRSQSGGRNESGFFQEMYDWLNTKSGMKKAKKGLERWQIDTSESPAMAIKIRAEALEKGMGKTLHRDPWVEALKMADKYVGVDDYLHLRAANQAYMEYIGLDKVRLMRGTDGRTGKSMVQNVLEAVKRKRTKWSMTESSLSGWTTDTWTAYTFGTRVDGVVVRHVFKIEDIIVHRDCFSGWTGSFTREHEYITKGLNKFFVNIRDIAYVSPDDSVVTDWFLRLMKKEPNIRSVMGWD